MSFETYSPAQESLEKENRLYPKRASFSIDESIEKLKKLKSGEIKPIELSEKERADILSFENKIGIEFEEIDKIKVSSAVIYPEYLSTEKGKAFFRSCVEFDVEGEDAAAIEKFIYRSRGRLANINGVQLKKLEGELKKYSEDELIEKLSARLGDKGELDVENIKLQQPFTVLLNPEIALDKIQKLRNFKRELKKIEDELLGKDESGNYENVLRAILEQYKKRLNEIIVDQFGHAVKVKVLAEKVGEENLSEEESNLLQQFSGLNKFVSVYSRFDKFIFGVENELDKDGNLKQVGADLEKYADDIERRYIENELLKKQKTEEKGLDFSRIMQKNIPSDVFAKYAESFLEEYGERSSMPAEQFDPKRRGPAPDGKWQFVTSSGYGSMSVNMSQKIIKAPIRERSVQELISIMLGHESTHFIQALNQSKIKLKLYDSIGGDRRQVLAEGAAMSAQKTISEEIFGFSELPKPNYIKTMARKINGGSYIDCVKEYYECSLRIYMETKESVSEEVLKEKAKELLGVSVRSCKRLFKSGEDLNSKASILSKSKDTVYMEQLMVMNRLKEEGLEKFALVRGLNLDSLFVLLQNGFIQEKDIETLDVDFIRKTWEELKGDFVLQK